MKKSRQYGLVVAAVIVVTGLFFLGAVLYFIIFLPIPEYFHDLRLRRYLKPPTSFITINENELPVYKEPNEGIDIENNWYKIKLKNSD